MTKKEVAQLELFKADVSWFHVFKELIRSKAWAKMSPSARAVYPVIKAFTNWQDGRAFPSFDTLQEYSGLSSRTSVTKALKELEKLGFIEATRRPGRQTLYKLVEKFEIEDAEGRPVASATFDYLPGLVKDAVTELRNFVASGLNSEEGNQYIHIEHLTLNVAGRDLVQQQNNLMDGGQMFKGLQDRLDGKKTPEADAIQKMLEDFKGDKKG